VRLVCVCDCCGSAVASCVGEFPPPPKKSEQMNRHNNSRGDNNKERIPADCTEDEAWPRDPPP